MGGGTYSEISKMLHYHYIGKIDISNYWSIGDIRIETIQTIENNNKFLSFEDQPEQEVNLIIIGFNHDELLTSINGKTKAAVTIQTLEPLINTGMMDDHGTASRWGQFDRREWCNDSFYGALSSELQDLIKYVSKKSNHYTYSRSDGTSAQYISDERGFYLSEVEITGTQIINDKIENGYNWTPLDPDGVQYEYMQIKSNRIKGDKWFTRTTAIESGTWNVIYIDTSGVASMSGVNDKPYNDSYIVPAFCM